MPKESSIAHPKNSYFLKIYDYQMELLDKNHVACGLVSLFESFHNSLVEKADYLQRQGIEIDDSYFFQYHSYSELVNRTYGIASEPTIIKSVKVLIEKNIISLIDEAEISKYNSNIILMQNLKRKQSHTNIYRFNDNVLNELISSFMLQKAEVKNFNDSGKNFNHHRIKILPHEVKNFNDSGKNFLRHNQNILEHNKNKPEEIREESKITYMNFSKIFYKELEKIIPLSFCKPDSNDSKVIGFHLKEEDLPLKMQDLLGVAKMQKELIERQKELDERGRAMARLNYPRYSIYELENRYKGIMTAYGQLPQKKNKTVNSEIKKETPKIVKRELSDDERIDYVYGSWKNFQGWCHTHITRSSLDVIMKCTIEIDGMSITIKQELNEFLKQIILKYFNEEIEMPIVVIFENIDRKL